MTDYTRSPLFKKGATRGQSTYWKGTRDSAGIPEDAILTEAGLPLMNEIGQYLLTES
jgi:hypothetical protein